MLNHYGPWATPIDTGMNPQLSSFWKRRLTMLVPTSQASPVLSRRNFLSLGAAGLLTGILPTLHTASMQAEDAAPARTPHKSSTGRIFLKALLHIKPKDARIEERIDGIIAVDPETGQWEKITDGDDVRVSHDGKILAVAKYNRDSKNIIESCKISTYDLTTRYERQVIPDGGARPCWSPDNKRIVSLKGHFTKDNRSQNTTLQINLDGSDSTKLPIPETDAVEDWSADGKWFVAVTNRTPPFGVAWQLFRMHPDGTEELQLTKDGLNCYPRFSPDGRQIVYLHQTMGGAYSCSLHVIGVDGQNDRELLHDKPQSRVESGCFSPDSRRLVILFRDSHPEKSGDLVATAPNYHLEIMDIDGPNRRVLPLIGADVVWFGHPDW